MKIKRLVMKNFMSHEETVLNLSDVSACSIIGNNGAGKSACCEAILWAIFGHARIPNKELIRSGQEKMSVELDFTLEKQKFSIHRSCKDGIVSLKGTVDGEAIGEGVAGTTTRLEKYFGIDRELLMESIIINQGRLSSFLTAYASQRRDLIIKALGLEKYTKAGEVAKQHHKDKEANFQSHQNSFLSLQADVQALPSYEECDAQMAEASQQLKGHTEKVKEFVGKRDVLASQDLEARESLTRLTGEAAELRTKMTGVTTDFDQKIVIAQGTIQEIDTKASQLDAMRQEVVDLEVSFRESSLLVEQAKDLNARIKTHKADIDLQKENLMIAQRASGICPICRSVIDDEKWKEIIGQMKIELIAVMNQKEIAAIELTAIPTMAAPDTLAGKIEKGKSHITNVETLRDSKYTLVDSLNSLIEQKKAMLDHLTHQLQQATTDIDAAKARINVELDNVERELGIWEMMEQQSSDALMKWTAQRASRDIMERSLDQTKAKLEGYRSELPLSKFVASALSPNGIPLDIVEQFLPSVEKKAQHILHSLSDGKMNMKLEVIEGGKKGIEIVAGTDQFRPIKSLSGGEQTRVGLSMRIALSQMLFEMANCRFDVLFIDEPEWLDDNGIDMFIHSINKLRITYAQIFVISHVKAMQLAFPHIIKVEKIGEISYAKLL